MQRGARKIACQRRQSRRNNTIASAEKYFERLGSKDKAMAKEQASILSCWLSQSPNPSPLRSEEAPIEDPPHLERAPLLEDPEAAHPPAPPPSPRSTVQHNGVLGLEELESEDIPDAVLPAMQVKVVDVCCVM